MGNMSYCRWQNTLIDLRDCYYTLNEPLDSKEEIEAREELISLCQNIIEESGELEKYTDDEESAEDELKRNNS